MSDENNKFIKLGDIVHRLNNPLGAIRAHIMLFKGKKEDLIQNDEYIRRFIERIERDIRDVMDIVEEIGVVFRTSEGLESISVGQLIKSALSKVEIPETIEIVNQVGDEIPNIRATESLVEVFKNLISNAVEAITDKGSLYIIARQVKNSIEIDFIDTGRGISSVIEPSLFKPYFSTKEDAGHGLGLFWSRTYLRSISGDLEFVSSKAGESTTFRVSLPISNMKA